MALYPTKYIIVYLLYYLSLFFLKIDLFSMVAVLLMIVGLGLAETEQNYYVTRNSIP